MVKGLQIHKTATVSSKGNSKRQNDMSSKTKFSGIYILPLYLQSGKTVFFAGGRRMLDRIGKHGNAALLAETVVGIYEPCKFAQSICLN
jgi:hypothetical protein